jgi:hypothetical protein
MDYPVGWGPISHLQDGRFLRSYRSDTGPPARTAERRDSTPATGPAVPKLSWEETARAMAASGEDWSDWDSLSDDGLIRSPGIQPNHAA